MISGAFHVMAQEWRYYSREKSLIHTLHLSELVTTHPGDTIEIASTAPTGNNKVPPITFPPLPGVTGGGFTINTPQPEGTYNATYDGAGGVLTEYITEFQLTIIPCNAINHGGFSCALIPGEVTFVHAQQPGWYLITVAATVASSCAGNIPEGTNLASIGRHVYNSLIDASLTVGTEVLLPTLKIGGGPSESRETQGTTPTKTDHGDINASYLVYLDTNWAFEIDVDGDSGCTYYPTKLSIGAIRIST